MKTNKIEQFLLDCCVNYVHRASPPQFVRNDERFGGEKPQLMSILIQWTYNESMIRIKIKIALTFFTIATPLFHNCDTI